MNIKPVLSAYDGRDVRTVARKMVDVISANGGLKNTEFPRKFNAVKTEAEFDATLEELYDFADEHAVWLGL